MEWSWKGILQAVTASLLLQTGIAAVIAGPIIAGLYWFIGLSTEWLIALTFIIFAAIVVSISQGIRLAEWWRAGRHLRIFSEPVDFAQDTPPFAQIQIFRLSDLDPFTKEMIEIERSLPPTIRPQPNDGLFLFTLFRIGIQNQTSRTIKRTRLEFSEIRGAKHGCLPTILRPMNPVDNGVDLSPGEKAFFDVVSVPVLPTSAWKEKLDPATSNLIVHFADPAYPNRMPARTYEFCFTARGDDVTPKASWFRLAKDEAGSFDFREIV